MTQAMAAHQALEQAGERGRADRLALDRIVGRLSLSGLYRTLLTDWLPPICQSEDDVTRAKALNQTGKHNIKIVNKMINNIQN